MIKIWGASDDLIEIEGDIDEELYYNERENTSDDENILAFSDGTVLGIRYGDPGVWRISKRASGSSTCEIIQAPDNDDNNYSDVATLDASIHWIVRGDTMVTSKRSVK